MTATPRLALHLFRGPLARSIEESRPLHNAFSEGGASSAMAIARSLGDVSHNVYTSPAGAGPSEVLLLDFWADEAGMARFFADPNVQAAGGRLCTSYDETSWTPAPGAFAFHLPPMAGRAARFLALVRAPVHAVSEAVAGFNALVVSNAALGRRRGQLAHDLYLRSGAGSDPPELLGVDTWSDADGMNEHYRDEAAWRGFGRLFTGPQMGSVWEQTSGFTEW